jgi:hypothetical protein
MNNSPVSIPQKMCFFLLIFSLFFVSCLASQNINGSHPVETYTNQYSDRRHTIVIAAPAANNDYYQEVYSQIIAFDIDYAQSIIGKDNVVILGDKKSPGVVRKRATQRYLTPRTNARYLDARLHDN